MKKEKRGVLHRTEAYESGCPKNDALVVTTVLHEFAESLGAAVDAKDHHTRQHSEEVAVVAHALALRMGVAPARADIIHVAAHLHDVGKIGVPDAVLRKPGALSVAEWRMIRRHPVMGAEIVRPVRALRECGVLEMILHHHERFDGRGYPQGLAGQAIPLGARIIAVADSLSAMLQKRPYRSEKSFAQAGVEIVRNAGTQFDPMVVQAFCDTQDSILQVVQCFRMEEPPREMVFQAGDVRARPLVCARTARKGGL
jgi:putative nucleotidyltransferase with HDIG domain